MIRSIELEVVKANNQEGTLRFSFQNNIVDIFLDGEEICGIDYDNNFVFFLQKALRDWGFAKEEIDD